MSLDDLLRLHDRMVRKQIDACNCQTAYDWDNLNKAENAFYEGKAEFELQFPGVCGEPIWPTKPQLTVKS